jgi:hypothetical protein
MKSRWKIVQKTAPFSQGAKKKCTAGKQKCFRSAWTCKWNGTVMQMEWEVWALLWDHEKGKSSWDIAAFIVRCFVQMETFQQNERNYKNCW